MLHVYICIGGPGAMGTEGVQWEQIRLNVCSSKGQGVPKYISGIVSVDYHEAEDSTTIEGYQIHGKFMQHRG